MYPALYSFYTVLSRKHIEITVYRYFEFEKKYLNKMFFNIQNFHMVIKIEIRVRFPKHTLCFLILSNCILK